MGVAEVRQHTTRTEKRTRRWKVKADEETEIAGRCARREKESLTRGTRPAGIAIED